MILWGLVMMLIVDNVNDDDGDGDDEPRTPSLVFLKFSSWARTISWNSGL